MACSLEHLLVNRNTSMKLVQDNAPSQPKWFNWGGGLYHLYMLLVRSPQSFCPIFHLIPFHFPTSSGSLVPGMRPVAVFTTAVVVSVFGFGNGGGGGGLGEGRVHEESLVTGL